MKRSIIKILSIMFIASFLAVCFVSKAGATNAPVSAKQQPAENPVLSSEEIQAIPVGTEILYEINFDSPEDMDYFAFDLVEDTSGQITDGMMKLTGNNGGRLLFDFNHEFPRNSIFHLKVKTYLIPSAFTRYPMPQIKLQPTNLGINFANLRPIDWIVNFDYSDKELTYVYFDGPSEISDLGQWLDIILFLGEDGREYRAIIYESDNPSKMMWAGITMAEEKTLDSLGLQFDACFIDLNSERQVGIENNYVGLDGSVFEGPKEIDIDYIRIAAGPLQSYLASYVPTYSMNRGIIDEYLDQQPPRQEDLILN